MLDKITKVLPSILQWSKTPIIKKKNDLLIVDNVYCKPYPANVSSF